MNDRTAGKSSANSRVEPVSAASGMARLFTTFRRSHAAGGCSSAYPVLGRRERETSAARRAVRIGAARHDVLTGART